VPQEVRVRAATSKAKQGEVAREVASLKKTGMTSKNGCHEVGAGVKLGGLKAPPQTAAALARSSTSATAERNGGRVIVGPRGTPQGEQGEHGEQAKHGSAPSRR
jgi:hypothetical protein